MGNVQSTFADMPDISNGLKKFLLKLVSAAAEKIGWNFPEGENLLTGQLRALLIAQAGLAGHQGYVNFRDMRKSVCSILSYV